MRATRDENDVVLPMDGDRYLVGAAACCCWSAKYWLCSEVGVFALEEIGERCRCNSIKVSAIVDVRRLSDGFEMDLGVRGDKIESSVAGVRDSSDRWDGRCLSVFVTDSACIGVILGNKDL